MIRSKKMMVSSFYENEFIDSREVIMQGYLNKFIIEGIPEIDRIKEWTELSEKLDIAFEYNDFFMPGCINDDDEYKRRFKLYKDLNRKAGRDTLHGVFLDITINSKDKMIRQICRERCEKSVITAQELKCRGVVFHTNYIVGFKSDSYREEWLKHNAEYYHELAAKYPDVNILIENMFDETSELITKLAEECSDIPNFGICFDAAHAAIGNEPISEWIDNLKKYIKHVHINDNDLLKDLHLPLGEGKIDYGFLENKPFPKADSILIEVKGIEGFKKSYDYLQRIIN